MPGSAFAATSSESRQLGANRDPTIFRRKPNATTQVSASDFGGTARDCRASGHAAGAPPRPCRRMAPLRNREQDRDFDPERRFPCLGPIAARLENELAQPDRKQLDRQWADEGRDRRQIRGGGGLRRMAGGG